MKFICYVNDLKDAAKLVTKCSDPKPNTPILAAVKITANDGVTFDATNFTVTTQIHVPANVEVTGSVCVNAQLFANIINKVADETITFYTTENQLLIQSGASNFKLLTFNAEEFPTTTFDDSDVTQVRAFLLKKLIRQTIFAASKDNDRPIFKGVNFVAENTKLTAVATNAARLAIDDVPLHACLKDFNAIVPNDSLKILADILPTTVDELVTISTDNRTITFAIDDIKFKTRLIEGEFPSWGKALEVESNFDVTINPKEILRAINRVNIIGRDSEYNAIVFNFCNGLLDISAQSDRLGSAKEYLEVGNFDGELTIAFAANYLTDMLAAVENSKLRVKLAGKVDPATFVDDDSHFVYVVTPVRI